MYHSLCPSFYNARTLELLDTDPYLQIIIASVAFTNGMNCKSLLDSLSLGLAETFDLILQELGRIREGEFPGRGVLMIPKGALKAAEKFLIFPIYST
jgi:hypothetical protein